MSLVSQRLIHDALQALEVKPHMFEITKGLVVSCKQASSRYVATLERGKLGISTTSKWDSTKKVSLEIASCSFEVYSDKLHFRAEEEQNWALVTEANSFIKSPNKKEMFFLIILMLFWN